MEPRRYEPHRGTVILVLGILALVMGGVGLILGPIAWMMGDADMKKYRDGTMDPEGEQQTNIGRILGMVATLLHAVGCVIGGVFILIYIAIIGVILLNAPKANPGFEEINNPRPFPEDMQKLPDFPELEKREH